MQAPEKGDDNRGEAVARRNIGAQLADGAGDFGDSRKTGERAVKEDRMPYMVDAVSLDHQGIVYGLANFFATHDIEIADVATRSYAAAHTGAPMFAVQMSVNEPSSIHIAQLREEFLELSDRLNLDAILEPVKG